MGCFCSERGQVKIKDIAKSVFSKLFEVGEPKGSPEDPFGTQGGIDLDSIPDGEPQGGPPSTNQQQGQQPSPQQGSPDLDLGGEEDKKIDQGLIDFAKRHKFVTDHDHGNDNPISYLKMSKDELKSEVDKTQEALATLEMDDDLGGVGSYDNDQHSYLTDKLHFLQDLIEKSDK